jgi:hypothetical protein
MRAVLTDQWENGHHMSSLDKASRCMSAVPEALEITFLALDFSQDAISPVTQDAPAGVATSSSSAPAPKALFSIYEQEIYNVFSPYPKAPILVMIDDPRRYRGLDPAYTATNINSPQELFDAVSRMLHRPTT